MVEPRTFLFLQGPPGPLFMRLASVLSERGARVHRINICGGDAWDWPEGAVDFRGRFSDWPAFIDRFLREYGVTDLMLYGDCRPYHVAAHGIAKLRNVRTHVLEEGYLRPHWMTFELEGVNARSSLSRVKTWFRQEALKLPAEPGLPPVTASFARRARDTYWHFHHVLNERFQYPHYRSHRSGSILMEGIGWMWKFVRSNRREKLATRTLQKLERKPLYLLPLQLSGDYQIRAHSLFSDMQSAASYVIESFAANAGSDVHLLLKAHPLDSSFYNWRRFADRHARRLRIEGRLHFVDGGDLERLAKEARGLVCVNSTSATLALAAGTPVCTIGEAVYDMPGLTHQEHLDRFWVDPTPPESGLYEAFRRVLVDRCLVRGGLASESAVTTLIESIVDRLGMSKSDEAIIDPPDDHPAPSTERLPRAALARHERRRSSAARSGR
jgi:capsular polysaccharide export protein